MGEATRLVKVLHHLPGLAPSSPLPLAVFDCLLNSADSPATKLYSLVSAGKHKTWSKKPVVVVLMMDHASTS